LTRIRGVTKSNLPKLKRLGVEKVKDLVYLFPHRHNDFANMRKVFELTPGEEQTAVLTVWEASETGQGPRKKSTQAILGDDTGNVRAVWFNQPWLARTLRPGTQVVLSGKVGIFRGQFVFESPDYDIFQGQEELVNTGRLVPIYPLTDGLYQRTLRRIVKQALDASISQVTDFLPDDLRHRTGLIGIQNAIAQMHYPDSQHDWATARRRLAFRRTMEVNSDTSLGEASQRSLWREAVTGQSIRHPCNSRPTAELYFHRSGNGILAPTFSNSLTFPTWS